MRFIRIILFSICFGILSLALGSPVMDGPESGRTRVVYFTDKDGLPLNIITSFVQDDFGYGWIGTGNGISRFDGYSFVNYDIFKGQFIYSLLLDTDNRLWVGTGEGLYSYNRIEDSFVLIQKGYVKQISEHSKEIYFLQVNRMLRINKQADTIVFNIEGINTCAVTEKGIWYASPNSGIKLLGTEKSYLPGRNVSLLKQVDDILWIFCRNGDIYNLIGEKLQKIQVDNHQNITDIEKNKHEYWIATDGNGILVLDKDFRLIKHLTREQKENLHIQSNSVYDISVGYGNAVWISTYGAGLSVMIPNNNAFSNLVPDPTNSNSLIDKEGVAVFSKNNQYFLGTNYGFSVLNTDKHEYTNFSSAMLKKQVGGSKITGIISDEKNNLWIGTYDGLVAKYSQGFNLLKTYHPCSESGNEMQQVVLMVNLDKNHILLGTHYRNKSMLKLNTESGESVEIKLDYKAQNKYNFQINSLRRNNSGQVVALIRNTGIFLFNNDENSLDNFVPEINSRITFKLNDFYCDKNGDYWFATQNDGLVKMSVNGRIFDKWTITNGFPSNSLLRIESVDDRILWISSMGGLCSFDMQSKMVHVYNIKHGLASNDFLPHVSTITPDKKIIFGHSEGFSLIDPEKQVIDTSKPDVIISDIWFHNQSIKRLDDEKYLTVPLENTKTITLPFSRNSFTIKFFTRDNDLPKFSNYSYRLIGLEKNWIYLGANNQTTYTNLSPGEYEFQVKCTNKSNVWNEVPTTLKIRIRPPWYRSLIANILYVLFILALIIVSLKIYEYRLNLKKEIEVSEFKALKEHELSEKKLAFFTNISHDLKTPLTLISSPVNDLLKSDNLGAEQVKKLEVIKRNANRLYKLISDLVDFRKITLSELPLKVQKTDLRPVIDNIYESFIHECHKRDIDFTFIFSLHRPVFVETRKIEKILWNLMANAVKFTHDGGKIWLKAETIQKPDGEYVQLQVGDTGEGFSEDEKLKIFDRFYQIQQTENIHLDGSGIGLSIVNDLVLLHHGSIQVESTPGKGSVFSIQVPAEENHYSAAEKTEAGDIPTALHPNSDKVVFEEYNKGNTTAEIKKYNLPKILIVEDNNELREYLASHFQAEYKVITATDGKDALKLTSETEPDIILTDAMMPNMNGYEFSKKIRENFNTSHIPIIMLTSNSETEQMIQGYSSGVDTYITKPFEIEYLDVIIKSFVLNRKRLREKFIGIELVEKEADRLSETDVRFFNELASFIQQNITNDNLNIDMLSKHFALSRTQLNRKIKALTNLTPNNYIRTFRLKKAYELIKNQNVRVSEAAYQTGFTDPNYFTTCFRKEFGENPSKIS